MPCFAYCPSPSTPQGPLYEESAGALLGGSILSLLLLSGKTPLVAAGFRYLFAANRLALAATQTTDAEDCFNKLATYAAAIPKFSGKLPNGVQTSVRYDPGNDAVRVVCLSIAMTSNTISANGWLNNLMWQGQANIANAVRATIDGGAAMSCEGRQGLCAITKAAWSFTDNEPANGIIVTVPGANPTLDERDYSCITNSHGTDCNTQTPRLPFGFKVEPVLKSRHDLSDVPEYCANPTPCT